MRHRDLCCSLRQLRAAGRDQKHSYVRFKDKKTRPGELKNGIICKRIHMSPRKHPVEAGGFRIVLAYCEGEENGGVQPMPTHSYESKMCCYHQVRTENED